MLAEIDPAATAWVPVVTGVANMGFAALVGWYLLTKAIPAMQDTYRVEMRDARTHWDAESEKRRLDGRETLAMVMRHCESEMGRRDEAMKVEMGLNRMAMKDVSEVLEEVRDMLREVKDLRA